MPQQTTTINPSNPVNPVKNTDTLIQNALALSSFASLINLHQLDLGAVGVGAGEGDAVGAG